MKALEPFHKCLKAKLLAVRTLKGIVKNYIGNQDN